MILLITYNHYFLILNLWNTIKFKYHNQWVAHLWYYNNYFMISVNTNEALELLQYYIREVAKC